jgi:uncharacterized hydrophobic protein (TIGR00271 family)
MTRAAPAGPTFLQRLGGRRRTLDELRDELFLDVGEVRDKQSRYWVLLALSTAIATGGLLADSTATVIGAMIVAPLGTPIMGIGLAVVSRSPPRLAASVALVVGGAATVVAGAAVLARLLPEVVPLAANGQVTARTSPSLVDLVAAVATGLAGAYGLARKDVSDVMPGVAIAISLVPPLSVVGITASAGDWGGAWGAFLLFAANVVAMVVAATVLFTLYGYHREAFAGPGFSRRRAYVVIAAAAVVIAVPLGLTTVRTVRTHLWLDRAKAAATDWAGDGGFIVVDVTYQGDDLVLVIEGRGSPPPGAELLARLAGRIPTGTPVVVNAVTGERYELGPVPAPG